MNAQVSAAQRGLLVGVLFVLVVTGCRDISTDRPIGAPCEAIEDCGEGAVCARQSQGSDNRICATVDMVEAADPDCPGGDCDFTLTEGDEAQQGAAPGDEAQQGAASGDEAPSPPAVEDGSDPSSGGEMEGTDNASEPPGGDGMQSTAACNEGDTSASDTRCGLNGRGALVRVCEGGEWSDSSSCDDPDACVDGTTQPGTTGCGLNDRGRVVQTCDGGAWRDSSSCDDPDDCVDGASQVGSTDCGLNARGSLLQICDGGAWRDGSECDDPDVCVDEATQVGTTVCGLTSSGTLSQVCSAGQWQDTSDCSEGYGDLPPFVAECEDDPQNPILLTVAAGAQARFPSILSALAAAGDGSTIEICPGTYDAKVTIALDITIRGADPTLTIIDGGGFHFDLDPGSATVENIGFTNSNANVDLEWSSVLSSGAIGVEDNYGEQETLNIHNCRFYGNTADRGAAIYVANRRSDGLAPEVTVVDSVFHGNEASSWGGAIYMQGRLSVHNSRFTENRARWGGAIAFGSSKQSQGDIVNSVIQRNQCSEVGCGIYISNCGNQCVTSLTVTDSDLGLGPDEDNVNGGGIPSDVYARGPGGITENGYGWYHNDVSFSCERGVCTMP